AAVRLASTGSMRGLRLRPAPGQAALVALLRGHVAAFTGNLTLGCGSQPGAPQCDACKHRCPVSQPLVGRGKGGSGAGSGGPGPCGGGCRLKWPSQGMRVNLATLELEYTPEPDLTVYNPHGPSISWSREYESLRGSTSNYNPDDFGVGWSHPYNVFVSDPTASVNPQVPAGGTANVATS